MSEQNNKPKGKTPFYKNPWFIGICCLLLFAGIMQNLNSTESDVPQTSSVASSSLSSLSSVSQSSNSSMVSSDFSSASSPSSIVSSSSSTTGSLQSSDVPQVTLGITPEDFQESFNTAIATLGTNTTISSIEWYEDDLSAQGHISDYLTVTFFTNPDSKEITSLIFAGSGDGTLESGLDVMAGMFAAIVSADPSIPLSDTGEMVMTLTDEEHINGGELVKNNIRYFVTQSDIVGTWLTIEPLQ